MPGLVVQTVFSLILLRAGAGQLQTGVQTLMISLKNKPEIKVQGADPKTCRSQIGIDVCLAGIRHYDPRK